MTIATTRFLRRAVPAIFMAAVAATTGCSSGGSSRSGASIAPGVSATTGDYVNVGPLATPRAFHTSTVLQDGRILIAGGLIDTVNATSSVEILDPTTGTVTALPPMSVARMHHEAVLLPTGRVLVVGGTARRYTAAHATSELYDPINDRWIPGPALSEGRCRPSVALFDSGKQALIAGGANWVNSQPTVLTSAEIYNADANTSAATNSMMSARCCAEAITQSNGQILLASGYRTATTAEPAIPEVFDIPSSTFIPVSMIENRAEAGLAQLGAEIYALGGLNAASQTLADTEVFNGQQWTGATPLAVARAQHTVTVTGPSAVVIGGRANNTMALKSTEIFPPSLAPAGTLPELNEARYDHTATQVGDAVYVIGGFTDGEQILASIEVYAPAGSLIAGAGAGVGARSNGKAPPPPTGPVAVTTLSPTSGNAGDTVTITGTGFAALTTDNVVRFNGLQAVVTAVNVTNAAANTMDVVVPAAATTGPVTVQIGTTIATGPTFTIGNGNGSGQQPSILLVFPNSAANFIPVSITGFNFGPNPTVTFNGVPTINIFSYNTKNLPLIGSVSELIVLVPPGATSGPLVVTNGTLQSNAVFFQVR